MQSKSSISINHYFPTGQSCICIWTTLHKSARGVNKNLGIIIYGEIFKAWPNDFSDNLIPQLALRLIRRMVNRNRNCLNPKWLIAIILNRNLGLAIRENTFDKSALSTLVDTPYKTMRENKRQGKLF